MNLKKTLYILVLIITMFTGCSQNNIAPIAHKGVIDLSNWNFEKQGYVFLEGQWEFYNNQYLTPEDFKNNELYQKSYLNIPYPTVKYSSKEGSITHGTLRLNVKIDQRDKMMGLRGYQIFWASKIWVNGELISSSGALGRSKGEYKASGVPVLGYFRNNSNNIEIVIQSANFEEYLPSIRDIILGTDVQIRYFKLYKVILDMATFGSIVMIGIYHLVVFFKRKKDKSFLYFAAICFMIAIRILTSGETILREILPTLIDFQVRLAFFSIYMAVCFLVLFLYTLFQNSFNKRIILIVMNFCGLCAMITLFLKYDIYEKIFTAFEVFVILVFIYITTVLVRLVLNKNRHATILLGSMFFVILIALNDILYDFRIIDTGFYLQIGLLFLISAQSYVLISKFTDAFRKVENLAVENGSMYLRLKKMNEELEFKVMERTMEFDSSNQSIKNLLDSAGQGFLSFGKDTIIKKQYSAECIRIFQTEIKDMKFAEVIFPDDVNNSSFINKLLTQIFNEEDNEKIKTLMSLLPKEILIINKYISIEYKLIDGEERELMVILSDVTEKRALNQNIEREKKIMKMIVKVIQNKRDFIDSINEYKEFCVTRLKEILEDDKSPEDMIFTLYKEIEQIKANLGEYDLININENLQEIENALQGIMDNDIDVKMYIDDIKYIMLRWDMYEIMGRDMDIVKSYLGKDFFYSKEQFIVEKQKILDIENSLIMANNMRDIKAVTSKIKELRYKSFTLLLNKYPSYISKVSCDLKKDVNEFNIEGDEILVNPDVYTNFVKSLVHVFKNIVDHGIEPAEERLSKGKTSKGNIDCRVFMEDNTIKMIISDDGRGIDVERIKNTAIKLGIYTKEEINTIPREEVLKLIFREELSTTREVDNISGHNMGLSTVMLELQKIGGIVDISSQYQKGTEFIFSLPLIDDESVNTSQEKFMKEIIKSTKKFIENHLEIDMGEVLDSEYKIINTDKLDLSKITSIINLEGIVNFVLILTFNSHLAKEVTARFMLDKPDIKDYYHYIIDTIGECSNIIAGNAIQRLGKEGAILSIGVPAVMCHNDANIRYSNFFIYEYDLEWEGYFLKIGLASLHK